MLTPECLLTASYYSSTRPSGIRKDYIICGSLLAPQTPQFTRGTPEPKARPRRPRTQTQATLLNRTHIDSSDYLLDLQRRDRRFGAHEIRLFDLSLLPLRVERLLLARLPAESALQQEGGNRQSTQQCGQSRCGILCEATRCGLHYWIYCARQ